MKKLLTGEEMFAGCENKYSKDKKCFEVVGKPNGTMKRAELKPFDYNSYMLLLVSLKQVGLEDYFQLDYEDDTLAFYYFDGDEVM